MEAGPKAKKKIFRLKPEEDARLPKLIEYAYLTGYIPEQSFQDYIMFALNCAYTRLKDEYKLRESEHSEPSALSRWKLSDFLPALPPHLPLPRGFFKDNIQ